MRFRPCIDIHQGKVKQIVGSTLNNNQVSLSTNYISNRPASFYATLYKEDNLKGGHVIMLDDKKETIEEAIIALKVFSNGLQIGGGITVKNASEFVSSGASHVIVSSDIFTNGIFDMERSQRLVGIVGKDKIVLDLSCRKKENNEYFVVINKWQTFTDLVVTIDTLKMLSKFFDEFLIHGVDVEGKKQGVDVELLKILSGFDGAPITYAGGIKDLEDIKLIEKLGKGKINFTVGSALDIFGGDLSYQEVVNYVNKK